MTHHQRILSLSRHLEQVAATKIGAINRVTQETKILALNALIEAGRAGSLGRGFAVVAEEVKSVSMRIDTLAEELTRELAGSITRLNAAGDAMLRELEHMQGSRLSDLALGMVDVIDRNLYERSCDVRWWATDAAVVAALSTPSDEHARHASERLAVILGSYTVYLDLWIADLTGRVVASGRPGRYPRVREQSLVDSGWWKAAIATADGDAYVAVDVSREATLQGAQVATYATAVRAGGRRDGEVIGALGIFFDWEPQARAVVCGVRTDEDERPRTRCLLLDAQLRVIASSDGKGRLTETYELLHGGREAGYYVCADGTRVGFARTPGYETYRGLGWFGVVEQTAPPAE